MSITFGNALKWAFFNLGMNWKSWSRTGKSRDEGLLAAKGKLKGINDHEKGFYFCGITFCIWMRPGIDQNWVFQNPQGKSGNCDVIIREYYKPDSSDSLLGSLNAYDNGFSTNCSEEDILNIIRREGCNLGADIASLHDIQRPDYWSTCYRAKVDFYRLGTSIKKDTVYRNEKYAAASVGQRVKAITIIR